MTLEQAVEQYRGSKSEGTYRHSLSAFIGKKIVDVHGYLSCEYSEAVFKIGVIVLDDGSTLNVEGEHDFPYIASDLPGIDGEILDEVYEATADD